MTLNTECLSQRANLANCQCSKFLCFLPWRPLRRIKPELSAVRREKPFREWVEVERANRCTLAGVGLVHFAFPLLSWSCWDIYVYIHISSLSYIPTLPWLYDCHSKTWPESPVSPGRLEKGVEGRSLSVFVLQLLGRGQGARDAGENFKPLDSVLREWLFLMYPDGDGEAL